MPIELLNPEPQTATPEPEENEAERAAVKQWQTRVRRAKKKWEPEFERMRECMDFAAGLQWLGQKEIKTTKYVCNITQQTVNQKVATLYSRNPQAAAYRRPRLDFRLWDGKVESIQQALVALQQSMMMGMPDVNAAALLRDFQQGTQMREMVDKICRTLELVYQYEMDTQEPDFKESMKQVVRTAVVCGVGYVRLNFARDVQNAPSGTLAPSSATDRAKRAKLILQQIADGDLEEDSPEIEQLKQLAASFGVMQTSENVELQERLIVDYPPSTAIIPDEKCTSLKTFRGCRWLAQEFLLPLEEVNAFFETDIEPGGEMQFFDDDGEPITSAQVEGRQQAQDEGEAFVRFWEIFDITTKSHFFVADGWKDYLMKPEPVEPSTRRFWPIFGLTFNDVVVEPGANVTVYPPSDVELMKHPQKEWNRTRDALRSQRRANAPKYIARKGLLTENDKEKLDSAEPNSVIELEGIPNEVEPSRFLLPANHAPIDPMAYDTRPLEQDIMFAARTQEANLGPAPKNVTATVGTIAEQSRMTVASSQVDDLDSLLTAMAKSGGEMLLWAMSPQTVVSIAGEGAAWPMEDKAAYVNQIELTIVASSSGRPNKAIEIANFERLAPMLMQAGANPQFLVREGVKRLDDRLDVNDAFPLNIPALAGPPQSSPQAATQEPQQPLQELPSETPVPLAGA